MEIAKSSGLAKAVLAVTLYLMAKADIGINSELWFASIRSRWISWIDNNGNIGALVNSNGHAQYRYRH